VVLVLQELLLEQMELTLYLILLLLLVAVGVHLIQPLAVLGVLVEEVVVLVEL
jgi:hypothetical protein